MAKQKTKLENWMDSRFDLFLGGTVIPPFCGITGHYPILTELMELLNLLAACILSIPWVSIRPAP